MPDDAGRASLNSRSVGEIAAAILRRPGDLLWRRWNWKSALFSSIIRGSIFFSVNLFGSIGAAMSALATEFLFRPFVAGFYGAVIESFRSARPSWAATLVVAVAVPACNHLVEFAVHWARGTQKLGASVTASVSFSIISALFNIFAMRRGVLIVGDGRRPILEDLRRLPLVIGAFLLALPRFAWRLAVGPRSAAREWPER